MKEKNYKPIKEKFFIKNTKNDYDLALSFILDQIDFFKKKPDFLN